MKFVPHSLSDEQKEQRKRVETSIRHVRPIHTFSIVKQNVRAWNGEQSHY